MLTLFATCPKGLEYLLRDELRELGAEDAREALAGVHFSGTLELAYRACLWSRLASRVLLQLAEFESADADALYAGLQRIDWSQHLAPTAVSRSMRSARPALSGIRNSSRCAARMRSSTSFANATARDRMFRSNGRPSV